MFRVNLGYLHERTWHRNVEEMGGMCHNLQEVTIKDPQILQIVTWRSKQNNLVMNKSKCTSTVPEPRVLDEGLPWPFPEPCAL